MPESIQHIENLVNHGRFLEARTKAEALLKTSPDTRLSQLYALALSKSGMPEAAKEYLEPVYKSNPDDPETAGILGSIFKELFKKSQQSTFALQSRDTYLKNFVTTQNYYTGINAASMSAMIMQAGKSRDIAQQVISMIKPDTTDFWELATLGEAYMLLKDRANSIACYVKARKVAGADWGRITSVYNQLWLLNHYIPVSGEVMKVFNPPGVVAFVGHMIDHPERKSPRFPPELEPKIKEAIRNSIRTLNAKIGYCSLACGGDILFAEVMAEEDGELTIFLPFNQDDFLDVSVRFAGEHWVQRFHDLRQKFSVRYVTNERYENFDDLFTLQSRVIFGSAVLRSAVHHAVPSLLTVLSEVDLRRSTGGTRDTIRLWPYPDRYVNINPDVLLSSVVEGDNGTKTPPVRSIDRPVQYLVLADLSSMKTMEKERIYKLINQRLDEELIPYADPDPAHDRVLMVFEFETSAMEMVRALIDAVPTHKKEPGLKITLHVGPLLRQEGDTKGEAINLIYTLSAVSPRGALCASSQFAALLALDAKRYEIQYAGIVWGKEQAEYPVYQVVLK
ncbi:MAG: TRAFs-binding domain-containing protein [Cyclobacteriaceae bacterium]|nr:TRAFs-binding domain-containing protein [Cyclobacteriaceae bacterium]